MIATEQAQTLEFRIVRQVKTQPPLTFTVQINYDLDDNGYLVECIEMDVVTWGDTWDEAVENLADAVLGVAKVLVKDHASDQNLRDPRINHAQFIASLGSEESVRKILGL
ncbi:MAG: hypothetical protein NZ805_10450 [Armatimonadetes bacterium]|nr:hypothetical protein [Armatimonadota bacterium]MDW8026988.1 hypothetical protein [Armatimonadota bacterium]